MSRLSEAARNIPEAPLTDPIAEIEKGAATAAPFLVWLTLSVPEASGEDRTHAHLR